MEAEADEETMNLLSGPHMAQLEVRYEILGNALPPQKDILWWNEDRERVERINMSSMDI
ncbi:MAG: hypothetical protein ABEI52_01225 [Halobacteriaceae archaeon]